MWIKLIGVSCHIIKMRYHYLQKIILSDKKNYIPNQNYNYDYNYRIFKKHVDIYLEELMKTVSDPKLLSFYLEVGRDIFDKILFEKKSNNFCLVS